MPNKNGGVDLFSDDYVTRHQKKAKKYKTVNISLSKEAQLLEQQYIGLFKVKPQRSQIYLNALKDVIAQHKK